MLRNAVLILLTLSVAIGGGTASVWYALGAIGGLGSLTVGGWTAWPNAGTPDADPYALARVARDAELPLGRAEGLTFMAERAAAGERLSFACTYRIEGHVPPARFFTLHAADPARRPGGGVGNRARAIAAPDLLRQPDNSI